LYELSVSEGQKNSVTKAKAELEKALREVNKDLLLEKEIV
jgi:hypothetical protein